MFFNLATIWFNSTICLLNQVEAIQEVLLLDMFDEVLVIHFQIPRPIP